MDDFVFVQIFQSFDHLLAKRLGSIKDVVRIISFELLDKNAHVFALDQLHDQMELESLGRLIILVHEIKVLYNVFVLEVLTYFELLVDVLAHFQRIVGFALDDLYLVNVVAFESKDFNFKDFTL